MASPIADSDATTGSTIESGHELDVVHRENVGGIRHGDGKNGPTRDSGSPGSATLYLAECC